MTDRGRCFCGEPLIMAEGGAACSGCSLGPMDCMHEGDCLTSEDGPGKGAFVTTRSQKRDSGERAHFEDIDGQRLILHHATPEQRRVLRKRWGADEISREQYRERERRAMGAEPPEGKA